MVLYTVPINHDCRWRQGGMTDIYVITIHWQFLKLEYWIIQGKIPKNMFSYYILVSLYDSRNIPQRECSGNEVIGTEQFTNRTLRINSSSTRPCWQNSLPTRRCWRNSLSTRPCWQNNCQTRPCWQNDLSTSPLVGWFSSPSHKAGTAQLGWRDGSARPTSQALKANSK